MGVPFEKAEFNLDPAAAALFDADPTVRSVGITRHQDAYGFRAVRNSAMVVPLGATVGPLPSSFDGVPVIVTDTPGEVESLLMMPGSGPGSPAAASVIPEVRRHRPAVCGLQIQNFDDDDRQGVTAKGFIIIGTLGCFVRLDDGGIALLSNNHVIAGENRGVRGADRILQPGDIAHDPADQVAVLTDYADILDSPPGAMPASGLVNFNVIDAGVARLGVGVAFRQGYLPMRRLVAPNATAAARPGDRVFKVGRTTGLTFGEVVDVAAIVGPVPYNVGPSAASRPCWFRRSITIEGENGTQFSDKGDSGSAIVRTNGEVVGLLYAGNGQQTYACPIADVMSAFNCDLAT